MGIVWSRLICLDDPDRMADGTIKMRGLTWLAAAMLAGAGGAGEDSATVRASLVSSVRTFQPGVPFIVGLRLDMAPGWHTYWVNPGDAGMATSLRWDLPDGFKVGDIQWPAPRRFVDGGLASYGYERVVILPVTLTPPADWPPGRSAELSVTAEWLQCRDMCIPGEARLAISLPAADRAEPSAEAAEIDRALRDAPRPDSSVRVHARRDGETIRLTVQGLSAGRPSLFYPATPGVIRAAETPIWTALPSGFEVRLPLESGVVPPARMIGVLRLDGAHAARADLLLEFEVKSRKVK